MAVADGGFKGSGALALERGLGTGCTSTISPEIAGTAHHERDLMNRLIRPCLLAALLWSVAAASFAGVYQCKSASGAVIFSDQPCAKGATGGEIAVKPASGVAPIAASDQGASAHSAAPSKSEASITAACRKLHLRMEKASNNPQASEAEMESLLSSYSKDCLPREQAAQQQVWARQKQEADAANRRNACDTKHKVVSERRSRWSSLSEADRHQVVVVEKEVANECR